jgi:hypothetical protein
MISARIKAHFVACAAGAGAAFLYRFPPELYRLYPQCLFHAFTHLYCPGCGATRALFALLHGQVAEAMHYNALLVVLLPFLSGYFGVAYWKVIRDNELDWPRVPVPALICFLLIALGFTVLRNTGHFQI